MLGTLGDLRLVLASLTGPLVDAATHVIGSLGYAGVVLMCTTSGVIGLPGTEPTMLFAGFNVFQGHLSLPGIVVFGVLGDLAGASIAYAIGYFGRTELLERHSRKLHISPARLQLANDWFDRYGAPVILVSRLLPFVRAVFPYAAGVGEMPYWKFLSFAAIGSVIWIGGLGVLGKAVGSNWESWRHNLEYVDYAAAVLLVVAIAYGIVRLNRARRDDPTAVA